MLRFLLLLLPLCLLPLVSGCGDEEGETEPLWTDPYKDAGPTRIAFTNASEASGITKTNHSGRAGRKEFLLEAVGPGASWFDHDQDGFLDVYIPDGDVFRNYDLVEATDPATGRTRPLLKVHDERKDAFRDQLWRNNGDGTFTDIAAEVGIVEERWSFGSTPFDYDGDGDTDIFVCNFGKDVLWRNNGDGTYTDIAEEVGLAGDDWTWSTAAAVGDVDDDGRLDVYVATYSDPAVEVDRLRIESKQPLGTPVAQISGRACTWKGLQAYCGPIGLKGTFDALYRQTEDGTYEDMTDKWGVRPRIGRYAFTALMYDYNEDGLLDIYVANDSVENFMWQQSRDRAGRVRFRDTSDRIGIKVGSQINAQASMGMALGDVNRDGLQDIVITNFSHDYNNVYVAQRAASGRAVFFKDKGLPSMGQAVYYDLSWGVGLYDFDNDGDLDLYIANGHVYKEIDLFDKTGTAYDQKNALFECMEPKKLGFREIGTKAQENAHPDTPKEGLYAGDGMELAYCSRQAAFADYNNDGLIDILVQNMNEPPNLLRNTSKPAEGAAWIKLSLRQPGGNRDALGARIRVSANGQDFDQHVVRQKSFLGADDPRLHFGLGAATGCVAEVIWPGAAQDSTVFTGLEPGAWYVLDRATGKAEKQELKRFAE